MVEATIALEEEIQSGLKYAATMSLHGCAPSRWQQKIGL